MIARHLLDDVVQLSSCTPVTRSQLIQVGHPQVREAHGPIDAGHRDVAAARGFFRERTRNFLRCGPSARQGTTVNLSST
jgi:hypothetical protein